MKTRWTGLVVTLAVVTAGANARAALSLDFNIKPQLSGSPASVSFDGAGGPLTGANIVVDSVVGTDTFTNNNQELALTGGRLNFTTGAFKEFDSDGHYVFNSGGSVTLTGAIPSIGITDTSTVLLTATFTDSPSVLTAPGGFKIFGGGLTDDLNSILAAHYGVSAALSDFIGELNLGFRATSAPVTGAFTATGNAVGSGDITAGGGTIIPLGVPEPSTLLSCGLGALTLIGFAARRRLRAA